ncbi:protease Do-like 9 [Actinidia eriantha]|uniref:protease Do-like 9 n=1 Tax=Actinidia eriantha TaxID=165200 RepID=UPI002590A738|nr:protease Do-like 9 [Actinidia eriantha]
MNLSYKGDKVTIAVLRDSKTYEFVLELSTYKQFNPAFNGRPHSYYVVGGFVFITLCPRYLRYVYDSVDKDVDEEGVLKALYEEQVIVSKVLKDEMNNGYDEEEIEGYQVLTFNGKPVHGLKDLVVMVESCNEEFLEFILQNHKVIVLCTKSARARTREILKMHGIPSAISDDLNPRL